MDFSNQCIVQGKFFTWSFCWISWTWSILGVEVHCQLVYLPASFPGFGPLIVIPAGCLLLEQHKYFPPKRRLGTTDSTVCARTQPEARAYMLIMPNTQGLQLSAHRPCALKCPHTLRPYPRIYTCPWHYLQKHHLDKLQLRPVSETLGALNWKRSECILCPATTELLHRAQIRPKAKAFPQCCLQATLLQKAWVLDISHFASASGVKVFFLSPSLQRQHRQYWVL